MYEDIFIKSYRGLRDIELRGLGAVNVLIGDNNSGKTSILEAIRLLDSKDVIGKISQIASEREGHKFVIRSYSSKYDYVKYSFPLGQERSAVEVSGRGDRNFNADIYACMEEDVISPDELDLTEQEEKNIYFILNDENKVGMLRGMYRVRSDSGDYEDEYFLPQIGKIPDRLFQRSNRGRISSKSKIKYISPADVYFGFYTTSFLKGLELEEKERLISLMRIFEPSLVNIEASIVDRFSQVVIEDTEHIIKPISVYGDGMKRVFSAAGAIAKMQNGVLLIDEFDTGIHSTALPDYTSFLSEASNRNNTQLFLTTHSGDAINALVKAYDGGINLNVYKLETYEGNVYVRKYEGTEIHHMWTEQGTSLL